MSASKARLLEWPSQGHSQGCSRGDLALLLSLLTLLLFAIDLSCRLATPLSPIDISPGQIYEARGGGAGLISNQASAAQAAAGFSSSSGRAASGADTPAAEPAAASSSRAVSGVVTGEDGASAAALLAPPPAPTSPSTRGVANEEQQAGAGPGSKGDGQGVDALLLRAVAPAPVPCAENSPACAGPTSNSSTSSQALELNVSHTQEQGGSLSPPAPGVPPLAAVEVSVTAEVCGLEWQQEYAALHRSILQGQAPQRFFVSLSIHQGAADRLIGLAAQLYFALFTGRVFQLATYDNMPGFDAAYEQPNIDWVRRQPLDDDVYAYLHRRRLQQEYADPTGRWFAYYLVNDWRRSNVLFGGNLTEQPAEHVGVPTVYMAKNWGSTWALGTNKVLREQLQRWKISEEHAFFCALDFLFRPNAQVHALAQPFSRQMGDGSVLKIGIQVRVGDQVFLGEDKAVDLESVAGGFFDCARELETRLARPGQKTMYFLISDSLELRKQAKLLYGDKIVTDTTSHYMHADCTGMTKNNLSICSDDSMSHNMRYIARDMLLFSQADAHVITKKSGFGKVGALMSKPPLRAYYPGKKRGRSCQDFPLHYMARFWSAI